MKRYSLKFLRRYVRKFQTANFDREFLRSHDWKTFQESRAKELEAWEFFVRMRADDYFSERHAHRESQEWL